MSKNNKPLEAEIDFYSTREAAKVLGVSVTTIQLWVEARVLPAWKTTGGHRRIPRGAVDAMRAQQSLAAQGKVVAMYSTLVVEDDPVQRELYQIKFAEWQLPTALHLANDGFEGLVMAGKYRPDLIIADLSLPGMDGFEMLRRLIRIKDAPVARVIAVTALNGEEIKARGGLPEGIPVYPKPISFGVLKQIVNESLLQGVASRA